MDALNKILGSLDISTNNSKKPAEGVKTFIPTDEDFKKSLQRSISQNIQSGILSSYTSPSSIDLGQYGYGDSKKYDYNVPLTTILSGQLERSRSTRQPVLSKAFNAIVGGVASGGVGILENFSVLADSIAQKAGLMEDFEKSFISENLGLAKDFINEQTPIYRQNRGKTFDFADSGWYFEMLKGTIDSAVAFGFAGAGYAGIAGRLGSLLGRASVPTRLANVLGKTELAGARLNVLTRNLGSKIGMPGIADDLTTLGATFLSNHAEGTVMALELYEGEKEKLITAGKRTLLEQKAAETGRPVSEIVLTQEELDNIENTAIELAGKHTHAFRNNNMLLMLTNFHQMQGIKQVRNWLKGGGSTVSRNMLEKPLTAKDLKFWKNQAMGAPVESLEEITQNVLQMEGMFQAQSEAQRLGIKFTSDELISTEQNFGKRLVEFATSDQALLEGLMGFISGPIQYGLTRAPFAGKALAAENKRYMTQQMLIGRNKDFITNKLNQIQSAEQLASRFDQYRDEILGRDPALDTPELRQQDAEKFTALLENTQLDTLIQENLFNGTTADLESQLQEAANKQATTAEEQAEVENARKALAKLNELENKFVNYNRYINGAEIFAADLRGQRLDSIIKDLESSFSNRERQMTEAIQAQLEADLQALMGNKYKGSLSELNKHFAMKRVDADGKVDEEDVREVNSVTDIVKGYEEGYQLFSSKTGDKALEALDPVNKAIVNRNLLDNVRQLRAKNTLFVNEAKSVAYQSLYADYVDAMGAMDENGIHEMQTVKDSLESLLKDERFAPIKDKVTGETRQPFEQLKTSIEQQIEDLNNKINGLNTEANNLAEEEAQALKQQSSADKKAAQKGTSPASALEAAVGNLEAPAIEFDPVTGEEIITETMTSPAVTEEVPQQQGLKFDATKRHPPLDPEALRGFMKKPYEERAKFKNKIIFQNPVTGNLEEVHSIKETSNGIFETFEISFVSEPNKFHTLQQDDLRFLPMASEINTGVTPTQKAEAPNVAADSVNPPSTQDTGTDVPANQIDNALPKAPLVGLPTGIEGVTIIPGDPTAIVSSMEADLSRSTDFEQDGGEVSILIDRKGNAVSANVKTLDYNENDTSLHDAFANFMNNKQNKEGVVVELYVDELESNPARFGSTRAAKVKSALNIFAKIKKSGAVTLDQAFKDGVINEEERSTLLGYLPVKFNVKGKQNIYSHIPVQSSSKLKYAEEVLRTDTINATLSGKKLDRQIIGQGPGRLNVLTDQDGNITPQKVIDFIKDDTVLPKVVLHVVSGGALVPVSNAGKDLYEGVKMNYTDAEEEVYPWDGVLTFTVTNMAGKKYPVKLNTIKHTNDSAKVAAGMLRNVIDKSLNIGKENVLKRPLKDVNPAAYQWISNNIPTMLDVYGQNITLAQALGDMVFYGQNTIGSYGRITIDKGVIEIGGENNTEYNNNGKPIQFNLQSLSTEEGFNQLVDFIEKVKPFNIQVSKLREGSVPYIKHVFSSYLETTVNLANAFEKQYGGNRENIAKTRYRNAHLYISALPIGQEVQKGAITETIEPDIIETPQVKQPPTPLEQLNTSNSIKPTAKSEKKTKLAAEETVDKNQKKVDELINNKVEKEIEQCPTGLGKKPAGNKKINASEKRMSLRNKNKNK